MPMNKIKLYLIIINVITFVLFGADAIKNKNRISEFSLFVIIMAGSPIGAIIGMLTFHHKTKKIKFYFYIAFSIMLWLHIILGKGVKLWNIH